MGMTINQIATNQMSNTMTKLATMKRINSAADDAAGLAIAEKIQSQISGLEKGNENTLDMQNLVNTAEGGLSVIDDSLQRIRELSVQASNGIYTDEDKSLIQNEINQLKQGINDIAQNTQFNNMNLLDGSFTNKLTASSPDGSGAAISIPDVGSVALGLKDYDITGDFDLSSIDNALSSISGTRSYLGAVSNRFDYTINSNSITMLNQAAAKSRVADLDIAKASTDLSREKILNDYQIYAQQKQQDNARQTLSLLF